jgi:hypothetical protein
MDRGQTWVPADAPTSTEVAVTLCWLENNGASDNPLGVYRNEIIQLNAQGSMGETGTEFLMRESPSRASPGYSRVRPLQDGTFAISSFFDIWTEVSLDGGDTWMPSRKPTHVELLHPTPP